MNVVGNDVKKEAVLAYDGTMLAAGCAGARLAHADVIETVRNVFLKLVVHEDYKLILCCENWAKDEINSMLENTGKHVQVVAFDELDVDKIDIFFTASPPMPEIIQNTSNIAKYIVIYDVLQLARPEIEGRDQKFDQIYNSLNHTDHYFCTSEYTKKDLLRFCGDRINPLNVTVTLLSAASDCNCCCDDELISAVKTKYGLLLDVPYIFTMCTLNARDNLLHSVREFLHFIKVNDLNELCLVLGGVERRELIDAIGETDGIDQVICISDIAKQDISLLYSGAIFTVYTGLYDGSGIAVIEAMKCGCPVIASNTAAVPEIVGDAGILIDPQDPIELRRAFKAFYGDPNRRAEARRKGVEQAAKFSWERSFSVMIEVIKKSSSKNEMIPAGEHKTVLDLPNAKKKMFGKVWTEKKTTVYFLGIPVARKDKTLENHVTKIFGIPLIKKAFQYYVATTYFGPIPIKRRPNYAYIEQQVDLYTGILSNSIQKLNNLLINNESKKTHGEDARVLFNKKVQTLPSYQLVRAVERGMVKLEDELYKIEDMTEREGV